ncbi:flagella synthesis protein FlgN [Thiocystis violacea]|uniref:flagella synthesis protein FlgN n=1 Tax=Thiocystis violacea TaxID=13725 RepID=UPI0019078679|nr:flagellar protein FlgN [Thiocystis violacea]MBK1716730.1 hypothetical protein [Thiocystis violacea]
MDQIAPFVASLDSAIEDMSRLESVMLEETRTIESRDVDGLQRAVAEKQRLVTRLEAETARQKDWIEGARLSFTPEGIEAFIQAFDQEDRLGSRWSMLREHIRRCDQLNSDNARLIERDRRRIAATLRLLRGEDSSATTYDPQGRTAAGGQRGRTISQA